MAVRYRPHVRPVVSRRRRPACGCASRRVASMVASPRPRGRLLLGGFYLYIIIIPFRLFSVFFFTDRFFLFLLFLWRSGECAGSCAPCAASLQFIERNESPHAPATRHAPRVGGDTTLHSPVSRSHAGHQPTPHTARVSRRRRSSTAELCNRFYCQFSSIANRTTGPPRSGYGSGPFRLRAAFEPQRVTETAGPDRTETDSSR